jgi:hypothetical protein
MHSEPFHKIESGLGNFFKKKKKGGKTNPPKIIPYYCPTWELKSRNRTGGY